MQELVFHTFEADYNSHAKTSTGNIRTSCLKYAHTFFSYVRISIRYFGSCPCSCAKNDAASNTNQLFEGDLYKFTKVHRIWCRILWRLLEFVCQKALLPATSNSCLKYSHTNLPKNQELVRDTLDNETICIPKLALEIQDLSLPAASNSFVAQTRRYNFPL